MRWVAAFVLAMVCTACSPREPAAPSVWCAPVEIGAQIELRAGRVARGAARFEPEEHEGGEGEVAAFSIDAHEVTNQQFAAFVDATNYETVAERRGPEGAAGAAVFDRNPGQWRIDPNANWRSPEGAGSSIDGRERYPVVAVAYEDAEAYARWANRRLPTELEWEWAARGASPAPADIHAEERNASGRPIANTWQGFFPVRDSGEDGFAGLSPIGCFDANANGAYDMIGNVWEWTSTPFAGAMVSDVTRGEAGDARVLKGGSNLCASNFCSRFRSGSRQPGDPSLGMSHIGFRTVGAAGPAP